MFGNIALQHSLGLGKTFFRLVDLIHDLQLLPLQRADLRDHGGDLLTERVILVVFFHR